MDGLTLGNVLTTRYGVGLKQSIRRYVLLKVQIEAVGMPCFLCSL